MQCLMVCVQVIVKKDDQIKLYCKGADNIIFDRLSPACTELRELTTHHLHVSVFFLTFFCLSSGCPADRSHMLG